MNDTEKLINQLSNELYGYEVYVKDIYVEITKTIYKVKDPIVDITDEDVPIRPNIRKYRFYRDITFYELKALYEHTGFNGLREEFEGMIKSYMDGE